MPGQGQAYDLACLPYKFCLLCLVIPSEGGRTAHVGKGMAVPSGGGWNRTFPTS